MTIRQYWVNTATGNDANDGTQASPKATLQSAISKAGADGHTYSDSVVFHLNGSDAKPVGGYVVPWLTNMGHVTKFLILGDDGARIVFTDRNWFSTSQDGWCIKNIIIERNFSVSDNNTGNNLTSKIFIDCAFTIVDEFAHIDAISATLVRCSAPNGLRAYWSNTSVVDSNFWGVGYRFIYGPRTSFTRSKVSLSQGSSVRLELQADHCAIKVSGAGQLFGASVVNSVIVGTGSITPGNKPFTVEGSVCYGFTSALTGLDGTVAPVLASAPYTDPDNDDFSISTELAGLAGTDGTTPGPVQAISGGPSRPRLTSPFLIGSQL